MPATPYVTSAMLLDKPASISWAVAPTLNPSTAAQTAQIQDACWKATSIVDTYCRQPLRATITTEELQGPGDRYVSVSRNTGVTTVITRRRPVTAVLAVQVSPAATFPPNWTLLPAGQYRPQHTMTNVGPVPYSSPRGGGNTIDVAPSWVSWAAGRGAWRLLVSYMSGWPHTGLTATAVAGTSTLTVDDVTGWAGSTGSAYDGQYTENVTVTAATAATPEQLPGTAGTVQAGPGTLTLASPLAFNHGQGVAVSALPAVIIHATVLAATVQALEVIDAIATQSLSGQMAGGTGVLAEESEKLLDPFRVVV